MPDFWPDELEPPFDDIGGVARTKPDDSTGLDVKCFVCGAARGEPCCNPVTGRQRRNRVSCIGRTERRA